MEVEMMNELCVVTSSISTSPTSGLSRFVFNLCRGLIAESIQVKVCASHATDSSLKEFNSLGITVSVLPKSGRPFYSALTRFNRIGKHLAGFADKEVKSPLYIVISDEAIDFSRYLEHGKSAYISNGSWPLLFIDRSFHTSHRIIGRILSLDMSFMIRKDALSASFYAHLFANSNFTKQLFSFLYGIPFEDVVYPPVNRAVFYPEGQNPRGDYILAIGRKGVAGREENVELLEDIASKAPLKVVGGMEVPGAENLGIVKEEDLRKLLSNASFLVSPVVKEYFGYTVAESLSCGTPVLAFDSSGPAEQILHGYNGWKTNNKKSFLSCADSIFHNGYSKDMRRNAALSAEWSAPLNTATLLAYKDPEKTSQNDGSLEVEQ